MAGKFLLYLLYFSCVFLLQTVQTIPLYFPFSSSEPGKYSGMNTGVAVAEVDKPLGTILEAVMPLGGSIALLIPQIDFDKRDPSGPDLGTGRSYTGKHTAQVLLGQLASNSPTGPGRRKRNSTDGGGASTDESDGESPEFNKFLTKYP